MNSLAQAMLGIIEGRIAKKMQVNPKLNSMSAWSLVASERPELVAAYNKAAAAGPRTYFHDVAVLMETERALAKLAEKIAHALVPIEEQIYIEQYSRQGYLSYGDAWDLVAKKHPELIRAYNLVAGHSPEATTGEILARNRALIGEYIRNLRQANPQMLLPEAYARAEKERPDLFRRLKDAAGREHAVPSSLTAPIEAGALGAQGKVNMRANALRVELTAIENEIAKKRAANPKLNYGEAWMLIAREQPELIRRYNAKSASVFVGRA